MLLIVILGKNQRIFYSCILHCSQCPRLYSIIDFWHVIGVPLVFETLSWQHGVMIGASVKSETTAAAEFKGWPFFLFMYCPLFLVLLLDDGHEI